MKLLISVLLVLIKGDYTHDGIPNIPLKDCTEFSSNHTCMSECYCAWINETKHTNGSCAQDTENDPPPHTTISRGLNGKICKTKRHESLIVIECLCLLILSFLICICVISCLVKFSMACNQCMGKLCGKYIDRKRIYSFYHKHSQYEGL